MAHLIDTSVLAEQGQAIEAPGPWAISVVTAGELHAGVLAAGDEATRVRRVARLAETLGAAPVIAIDGAVAARYAELRAAVGRAPTNDLWIAATALAHDFTLLTADRKQAALPFVRAELAAG